MPHDPKSESGRMQDPDRLRDLLLTTKFIASQYDCGALECTNNGMRELFQKLHSEDVHNHEVLFRFLHVRGYYPVVPALDEQVEGARIRYRAQYQNLMAGVPPQTGQAAGVQRGDAAQRAVPTGSISQGSESPTTLSTATRH